MKYRVLLYIRHNFLVYIVLLECSMMPHSSKVKMQIGQSLKQRNFAMSNQQLVVIVETLAFSVGIRSFTATCMCDDRNTFTNYLRMCVHIETPVMDLV